MEELQEKILAITSSDEARYFYHMTSQSGDKLLEEGLILANPHWFQSFLEFTDEELNNIDKVIKENYGNKIKNNKTIIIAGVYKDEMQNFIRPLVEDEKYDIDWEGVGIPSYIIDNDYLVGYIDMDSLELHLNNRAKVLEDNLFLYY